MLFPQVMPMPHAIPQTYSAFDPHRPDICYRSQQNVCPKYVGGIEEPIKMTDGTAVNPNN